MSGYRLKPAGDTTLIVEFGERIDRNINGEVLTLARALGAAKLDGVIEIAPTFRSLAVYYDPLRRSIGELSQAIENLLVRPKTATWPGGCGDCRFVTTQALRLISSKSRPRPVFRPRR